MRKTNREAAYQAAINRIEEQLRALLVSLAPLLHPNASSTASPEMLENFGQLQKHRRSKETGSVGNIIAS
jgi:hypothetical protein